MQWGFLFSIIFVAFFLNALTGFGGGLLSVPFLALVFPLTLISPLVNVLGLAQNTFLIRSVKKDVPYAVLIPLVIGNAIGSLVGVRFLTSTENALLTKLLGGTILTYAVYSFFKPVFSFRPNRIASSVVGAISGLLSATYAVGGPPLVMYLSGVLHDKSELRATMIAFFFVNGLTQVPMLALSGVITPQVLLIASISLPILFVAAKLGNRVHLGISDEVNRKVISAVLAVAGILLLLR